MPNGYISYDIPILKVPEYTADEILEKEMYFLIPFHIFAYEKQLEKINANSENLGDLLHIYKRFAEVLQQKVTEGRLTEYERQVIRDMTVKVADSLAIKWDNIKKGVENIMGGEILELEVDKIVGKAIVDTMISLVRDGLLDLAEGAKRGGAELVGQCLLDCHSARSNEIIKKVVVWFSESADHNRIYTFYNGKENKDVYMVALRDEDGTLIGYYEKHEYRNRETEEFYHFT